jgi:hypothetical protein
MDDSRFSTNLCPYKLGIMPRIEQLLLPNIADIGRGGVNDGGSVVAKISKIIVSRGTRGGACGLNLSTGRHAGVLNWR